MKKIYYRIGIMLLALLPFWFGKENITAAQISGGMAQPSAEAAEIGDKETEEGGPEEDNGAEDGSEPEEDNETGEETEVQWATSPVLEPLEEEVPLVKEGKLEYRLSVKEPMTVTVHYERQVTEIRGGETVISTETGETAAEFTEDVLSWSMVFEEDGEYRVYGEYKNAEGTALETELVRFRLDHQAPLITGLSYGNGEGPLTEKYGNIYSSSPVRLEFQVRDAMAGIGDAGVWITKGAPEEWTEGQPVYYAHGSGEAYYAVLPNDMGLPAFQGKITLWARDLAGNQSAVESVPIIHAANAPEIEMTCASDCEKWTKSDIDFQTKVTDAAAGIREIIYKINGKTVHGITFDQPVYTYEYSLKVCESAGKDNGYPVVIEAVNNCGVKKLLRKRVYIDKEAPEISLGGVEDAAHYPSNPTIRVTTEDVSYGGTKTNLVIYKRTGEQWDILPVAPFSSQKEKETFAYTLTEEGVYKVCALAVDAAGNAAKTRTLSFVVDKTPPELTLSGIKKNSMNGGPGVLGITCDETFYQTAEISIQVTKTVDGKTISEKPENLTAAEAHFVKKLSFEKDGTYQVTVNAKDKAGNPAKEKSITFSVDRTKPEVKITGIGNYAQWNREVKLRFMVEESYYKENTIALSGSRRDMQGRVQKLELPMRSTGKTSAVTHTFWEDGIYELNLYSKDKAGNASSEKIHFTIDSKAPQILNIQPLNGGYFKEFQLSNSLEGFFQDLTVISYRMLLNGIEYNGTDRITGEGKYSLYVVAEDAVGHISEELIEFIIDHTPPEVVFSGVTPDAVVCDKGKVSIDLADREDQITAVRLNGLDLGADVRVVAYEEPGAYQIEVDCVDFAGNSCTQTLKFVYNKEDGIREKPDTGPVQYIGGLTLMIAGLAVLAVLFINNRRKGGSS